jgi:hypothetical protein
MASKQTRNFCPVGFFVCSEPSGQENKNKHDRERERTHLMYSMIQLKTLVSCGRDPARSLPLRRGFLLIPLVLVCFAFAPQMQAVSPAPDGCYPGFTTAEGCKALNFLTTGAGNAGFGWYSLYVDTTGSYNTGLGAGTLVLNTADSNTAAGAAALLLNGSGTQNCAYGTDALVYNGFAPATGADFNDAFGAFALFNNSDGFENNAFGNHALFENVHGAANTAVGDLALQNNDTGGPTPTLGNINTAVGASALLANTDGDSNNAVGFSALLNNTVGAQNNAMGVFALNSNIDGASNVAIGDSAYFDNVDGSFNTVVGWAAGGLVEGSDNIYIGATSGPVGPVSESGHIRIGDTAFVTDCFIAGIFGNLAPGVPVYVDASGQLSTTPSSLRFKNEIKPMDKTSEAIFALKPVTFHYKKDKTNTAQFGLIAEEVAKVNPALIALDKEGKPYSVRYEQVNAMLLNEFLKEHRTVQDLKATAEKQQTTIALQESQIKALTASLQEQATQIQKVSAQVEMIKPAPQVVENR